MISFVSILCSVYCGETSIVERETFHVTEGLCFLQCRRRQQELPRASARLASEAPSIISSLSSLLWTLSDLGWQTNKRLSNLKPRLFWQKVHWTCSSREPLSGNLERTPSERQQRSSESLDPWLRGHAVSDEGLLIMGLFYSDLTLHYG